MQLRMGTAGALVLWTPVCFTAFAVVQYILNITARYLNTDILSRTVKDPTFYFSIIN